MIKSMAPKTGRMAVVLPHGALFRMGLRQDPRRKILEIDLIEGSNWPRAQPLLRHRPRRLHPGLRRQQAAERQGKVLLINGSDLFRKGRNQEHARTRARRAFALGSYRAFADDVQARPTSSRSTRLPATRQPQHRRLRRAG